MSWDDRDSDAVYPFCGVRQSSRHWPGIDASPSGWIVTGGRSGRLWSPLASVCVQATAGERLWPAGAVPRNTSRRAPLPSERHVTVTVQRLLLHGAGKCVRLPLLPSQALWYNTRTTGGWYASE